MRNIWPKPVPSWLVRSISVAFVLGAIGCRDSALAHDSDAACTIANVAGSYGYVGFGELLQTNAFNLRPGPESNAGQFALDGRGHFSLVETVRVGALTPFPVHETGTYTVDAGCNFALIAAIPPFIPKPIQVQIGVFVKDRRELRAIGTVPGLIQNYVSTARVR
jgi:hypothetical protein